MLGDLLGDIPRNAKTISLQKKSIPSLPANLFIKFTECRHLRVDNNKIQTIDDLAFSGLNKLEELTLKGNLINNLAKGTFKSLTSLKVLVLTSNKLSVIHSGMWLGLGNLQNLFLYKNDISTVKSMAFYNLTSLKLLDLRNNKIKSLTENILNPAVYKNKGKFSLLIGINPLECVQQLYWTSKKEREGLLTLGKGYETRPKCKRSKFHAEASRIAMIESKLKGI